MPDLGLETRGGLPDELAYLRASYLRADWEKHSNFGELSRFWLEVHQHLRTAGSRLGQVTDDFAEDRQDARGFRRVFVPGLNQFLQHLVGHHQIEDRHYFPKFRSLDPRMVPGFELLERDHEQIHEALLNSAGAANGFLAAFDKSDDGLRFAAEAYAQQSQHLLALLMRHLADEEDLIIPAMLHHGERSVG